MSGDNSTSCVGSMSRTNPSSSPRNENDSSDPLIQLPAGPSPPPPPPSRAPLNSIPDPSQIQHDLGHNNNSNNKEKSASGAGTKCKSDAAAHTPPHSLTPTTQKLQQSHQLLVVSNSRPNATPRRGPKPTSDPTSAPATPASSSKPIQHPLRISNVGPKGAIFSRGISVPCPDPHQLQHVPHFDLPQDHSFWKHHNVQVLIRIRPISNIEKVSQGYARCLRQETAKSLVWLGHPETRFTFDHIACETISQEKLFTIAGLPMVDNCMSGYNSCMFAYGQTGSGKTHTMMGDIGQMAGKLNEDCGITPRIFEYLFTRISEEENNRRNEGLKYSCKCSFLEIYNEQITDLLEPSSTNLQLREDLKKGVYVENLTEYSVRTVDDVLRLLLQGAANRKIAATHMNSESSRSHSVFTCIIESRWEKDSMTHIRFGRLNLVDLAGSERQKSSGAEGDRLKEAANINKSLSTLGLVIMSLVDLAQGKNRHVPYRDSRLTFLLQDSLGGNSKTTIIANVSPSICSANETLSTLKFAQRAKLIQNNAKVNEDASGDVIALQRQIQQLKGQLSILSKHSHDSEYLSNHTPSCKESYLGTFLEELDSSEQMIMHDNHGTQSGRRKKTMCSKATLLGALRRENLAELEVKRLKAEMEQLNSLVHQLELDAQHAKMILRSRDERIKHLELLADGFVSADAYILNENNALREEIELLQSRIGKNPELTRSALENIRLLEQLRLFKEFYGQGERETLLAEISELRDELSDILEAEESCVHSHSSPCKENQIQKELKDARSVIEAMESKQLCLIEELEFLRNENDKLMETLQNQQNGEGKHSPEPEHCNMQSGFVLDEDLNFVTEGENDSCTLVLQAKLVKLSKDLQHAQLLNSQYLKDHATGLSQQSQAESIQEDVEIETARTILHLQEEIATLQSELQGRTKSLEEENRSLRNCIAAKDGEMEVLCSEWERATLELTNFLLDGSKSIGDASSQIESIGSLFPCDNVWVSEHVERAAKLCVEKEESMFLLKRSLEDAQTTVLEMDQKLNSLRGATMVLSEAQHLESNLIYHEDPITEVKRYADYNFLEMKTNFHQPMVVLWDNVEKNVPSADAHTSVTAEVNADIELAHYGLLEAESAISISRVDAESHFMSLQSDIHETFSLYKELIQDLVNDIHDMRRNFVKLNVNYGSVDIHTSGSPLVHTLRFLEHENGYNMLHQILGELAEVNKRLNSMNAYLSGIVYSCQSPAEFNSYYKINQADSFFSKFEEAQATVKEADYMLNALLKSNDDAKQLTSAWKQVGNELMIQKANLFEEVNLLKSSIHFKESENEMLQHQIHFILTEIASLMFLIEGSFQKDVEDLCKTSYCDTILMVKETLNNISSLRSLLEEISAEVRENGIISFVFNGRYLGKIYDEIRRLNKNSDFLASTCEEGLTVMQNSGKESASYRNESEVKLAQGEEEGCQYEFVNRSEAGEDDLINEHLELKREVERKEVLLKGLLFDLSLLQESASSTKEAKDEIEKLHAALNQVRNELKMKTSQLDNMLIKHKTLEGRLMEAENALCVSHSDLEEVRGTLDILLEENAELRMLLKDVYLKKSETEQQLEEQRESVKDLEDEILRMASSAEEKMASSIKDIKDDMKRVTAERNQLLDQLQSLQDKLDIAYAVADEKEAIALEACQESEASKVYAEQKEEEVKILEHSVEELDSTINVLEKKVSEMEEEVERYRQVRDSLEVELHGLRERLLMVESITEDLGSSRELSENQFLRSISPFTSLFVELHEALSQIRILEEEKDKLAKEIKQYREYISEVVVHAEAQASQYQQKYKSLEAMIHEVRTDSSDVICGAPTLDKTEKTSVRSRGSSSPFRCIASLVQQMNMEKDQELSIAKFRIEELEALVASRQKEVCLLNTRLASVESMTHDVIRDLLGVKLDITNYADLVSQNRLQKLVEEAQHQAKQYILMEKEVLELRRRINDLVEERERCVLEVNRREADVLATHMILEQVRERDQLLTAQNEMLKADKTNLQRRVAELDDMVKKLIGRQNIVVQKQQQTSSFARLKG
ncbi:unnamed protein product [Coffea canephora]|uniref:Kinesin motor domain-containing protein n=1 Tax=Coffea canephora TaxID=49390 RepID=A0A068TQZ9_COFCA|nr:unnamed protein product [Coffea canephora]